MKRDDRMGNTSVYRTSVRAAEGVSGGDRALATSDLTLLRSRRRSHRVATYARGIVMVWMALLIFVLVGLLGLSADWGKAGWNVHELHNAADAGALAGAQVVKTDEVQARQLAIVTALKNNTEGRPVTVADNPDNAVDGEVVLGRWIRQEHRFIETDVSPNAVKVVGNRLGARDDEPPLRLHFGPVFNTDTVGVSRHAIAWCRGSTGAGIIVLAEDPMPLDPQSHGTGMRNSGNVVIDLRGVDPVTGEEMIGDIQVNAASMDEGPRAAMNLNGGSAEIYAGEINVVGWTNPQPTADGWADVYADPSLPFSVNPQSPRIEDPFGIRGANLTPPDIATMPIGSDTTGKTYGYDPLTGKFPTIAGGTLTLNPGYYPGGIQMSSGSITLTPGVYAFGGADVKKNPSNQPGLVLTGGSITGEGVMLYLTGDRDGSKTGVPTEYGRIELAGNALVQFTSRGDAVTPPQIEGEMGIIIWQDCYNPTYAKIEGTSGSYLKGTIYCGYNGLDIGGNGGQTGNQVIAGCLTVHGTMSLGVAYDGRNSIESYTSILVE
jgi:Flp pilus assembly protein TadG